MSGVPLCILPWTATLLPCSDISAFRNLAAPFVRRNFVGCSRTTSAWVQFSTNRQFAPLIIHPSRCLSDNSRPLFPKIFLNRCRWFSSLFDRLDVQKDSSGKIEIKEKYNSPDQTSMSRNRKPGSAGCLRRDGGRPLRCDGSCHHWGKAPEKRS